MSNPWYARYPGDYGRDTAHLSMIEHGAYGLLLDHYYSTAAPLPGDVTALYRVCRAFDQSERDAVDCVLSQFFDLRADGYHNTRADMELVKRNEHHERLATGARKTNEKRWGNRSATRSALACPQPQPQPQEKKNPAAKPTPPPDPRHKPFFDSAYEAFRMKHLQPPTWGGKHAKGLQLFLKGHPQVTLDEWQRRYRNFLASTDRFYQSQHGSLVIFVGHFDSFIDGPILERKSSNAKPDTNEAVAITMQGAAANARRLN
jgi:uncharacterized protein YdaU (DUF1376 family)